MKYFKNILFSADSESKDGDALERFTDTTLTDIDFLLLIQEVLNHNMDLLIKTAETSLKRIDCAVLAIKHNGFVIAVKSKE